MGQVRVNEKRKATTREAKARAPVAWKQPSALDAPPPREGMRQRWVATSILGDDISHHVMKKTREGWTPRPADTIPDDFPVPTMDHGSWKGCIGVEGLILCEMPLELVAQRTAHYKGKTDDQESFTETDLSSANTGAGGMELGGKVERSTSRGPGRQPQED